MENNKVELNDLGNDFITKEIGTGTTATCYLTKDGEIFKKYNGFLDYNILNIEKLTHYNCPYITFPKKMVCNNGENIGYIKNYAQGTTIENLDDSVNIHKFIESIKEMLMYFMKNGYFETFMFTDLSEENIVYDEKEKKMTIIDADFFEFFNDGIYMRGDNPYNINTIKENVSWINQSFYTLTRDCNGINQKIDHILQEEATGDASITYILKTIINELQNITGDEIVTIGDYKKSIVKAKEEVNGKSRVRHRRYDNELN